MRCRVVAFLIGFVPYALPGLPALALPPIDFCEKNPDSPLCDPVDPDPDPVDPCVEDPASCPVDPEPEPDPEPDPCDVDPASCEPEPEPEPDDDPFFGTLTGSLRVKAKGHRKKLDGPMTMVFRGSDFSLLSQPTCLAMEGTIVATRKLLKVELFLDDPAESTFGALVARLVAEAVGESPGESVGQSLKISVKSDPSGNVVLKIKGSVLFAGIGKVPVKAKYVGTMETGSIPEVPTCM
jgi:hypothetical protein